jgi:hypothetical protein
MFSVCVLLYGNYANLAKKLLSSLVNNSNVVDFRIGLNEVCAETKDYVQSWALQRMHSTPVYIYEENEGRNIGKYPLMRAMFKDSYPLAKKVMWFDDDSYVDHRAGKAWWDATAIASQNKTQIGSVHIIIQRGKQYEVIQQQPWYNRKVMNHRHRFQFATGGWWVTDSSFLLKWDYPFPAIYHNGGDSILGELIRQQNATLYNYSQGVKCHCESCVKKHDPNNNMVVHINVGGRAGRRGIGKTSENYVWSDGNPTPSLAHQNFNLRISRYAV